MLPAISDSLISGQPLYLLNSYSKRGLPVLSAALLAAFATQATGRVRLQVTGRPPTTSECCCLLFVQDNGPIGRVAASAPWSTNLRLINCTIAGLALAA